MAVFKYRMQNILDIKTNLETQAKQEFMEAQYALNMEEDKLKQLSDRKDAYEKKLQQELQSSPLNLEEISRSRSAIIRMEEFIKEQEYQVRLAAVQVEKASEKLRDVMIERKTQEKLKERAFEEFVQDELSKESKEVDELNSYRYGQKGK